MDTQKILDELYEFTEKTSQLEGADTIVNVDVAAMFQTITNGDPVEPPDPEPPDPVDPPVTKPTIQITVDKTNARWIMNYNDAGKPMMQIYPKDSAPVSDRIQFFSGDILTAKSQKIQADGGTKYYELIDKKAPTSNDHGNTLFVRDIDAMFVASSATLSVAEGFTDRHDSTTLILSILFVLSMLGISISQIIEIILRLMEL